MFSSPLYFIYGTNWNIFGTQDCSLLKLLCKHFYALHDWGGARRTDSWREYTYYKLIVTEKLEFCSSNCVDSYFVDTPEKCALHFNTWIKSYVWVCVGYSMSALNKPGATWVNEYQTRARLERVGFMVSNSDLTPSVPLHQFSLHQDTELCQCTWCHLVDNIRL